MTALNQFYKELLQIPIPEEFGVYDDYDDLTSSTVDYVNEVYHLAEKFNLNIYHNYGVSQLCFTIEGEDRVIKIGFNGSLVSVCDCDEDDEDPSEANYYEEFEPFSCNYTELTDEIYCKAYNAMIDEFFADIQELGTTSNGVTIYTQKYVKPYSYFSQEERGIKTSPKSLKRASELWREYDEKYNRIPFQDDWVAAALEQYGEDKFKDLMAFIKENGLNDFHTNNYGYTKDGKVCLLDYCGYGSW